MKHTDQTLIEQMRITDFDVEHRKNLYGLDGEDAQLLKQIKPDIELCLDNLIDEFYEEQTSIREISLIIGDAETLEKLKNAQRKYVASLFSGQYDIEYVSNRLRIGLVHKRIGVNSKLYLAAIHSLKALLLKIIKDIVPDDQECQKTSQALENIMMFDVSLVFETYISSLISEINSSVDKTEEYAHALEQKVRDRTKQLEEAIRIDALTGLQNVRFLDETLTRSIRIAERRSEPLSVVYIDIDNFKLINDQQGHQYGDNILRLVGQSIINVSRVEDSCFRYGGDEFCIILPNCNQQQAEKIYIKRLNEEIKKDPFGKNITLSAGIADTGPTIFDEPEKLIQIADKRMYEYKKNSKKRILKMGLAPNANFPPPPPHLEQSRDIQKSNMNN